MRHFVLAPSYHGATLLALLLSNHPEVVYPGDTNPPKPHVWCSCGADIRECPFWSVALPDEPASGKMLPTLHLRGTTTYLKSWRSFEDAALEVSGARIFIDGEKCVRKFLLFRSLERGVKLIHLTRDPRAFVYSAQRNRARKGFEPKSLEDTADAWTRGHKTILRASFGMGSNCLPVRYEDLATDPELTWKHISTFLGIADYTMGPPGDIHVIGNRVSLTWDGTVKLDRAWESELPQQDQERVVQMTEPLFSKLGYSREKTSAHRPAIA